MKRTRRKNRCYYFPESILVEYCDCTIFGLSRFSQWAISKKSITRHWYTRSIDFKHYYSESGNFLVQTA